MLFSDYLKSEFDKNFNAFFLHTLSFDSFITYIW